MSIDIPGYKIVRPIGRGGMATVYLAEQEIFEREVALKVMSKSLAEDPSFGQRFFREAKIVSQLVHPNIVTVHDVGEHDGHYYLSMEHIDGGDLKLARKRLTFRQKITSIKDIAKALQYAATKGYVHRDIKPENIMFHLADGRAVLTDFGIARAAETDASMTQTGVAIGTPHYMSPEQAKGQAVDGRSDIYSLGVVLYLLLAGRVPYDAESAVAIGIKHITDPLPELPESLVEMQPIIDKMMAKLPDERYQTAASLISALDNLDTTELEKRALVYDREMHERDTNADTESPTLVSAQTRAVGTPKPAISPTQKVPTDTSPEVRRPKPLEAPANQVSFDDTEFNDSIVDDDDPERFTVIYDTEVGSLDDGGGLFGAWIYGLLIVGAMAGAVYFYLNPKQWDVFVDKSLVFYDQTSSKVEGWLGRGEEGLPALVDQESSQATIQTQAEPQPTTPAESVSNESIGTGGEKAATEDAIGDEDIEQVTREVIEGQPEEAVFDEADTEEAGPSEAERQQMLVDEQQQRIESVKEAYTSDAAFLPDLVAAYRELLALEPESPLALDGLAALQGDELAVVASHVQEKKFPAATKKLAQVEYLFPETDKDTILRLKRTIASQSEIESLLTKANSLFSSGNILTPENQNALATYQQVLAKEANNSAAQAGVRKVSNYYLQQANEAFANEDIALAEEKVKTALEVDWKNESAVQLLENIRILQEKLAKQDLLYLQAEQALNAGNYFEPLKANAYHFYAQALEAEPEDTRALNGIKMTLEGFSAYIWSLVGDNKFDEARQAFVLPLNILPNDERLQSLSASVNQVIEDRLIANKPVIGKILISGKALDNLSSEQKDPISLGKSLYVIFSYENFSSDAGSLQARLLDGAGNIEIAQTSVDVVGGSNTVKFKIDSPVGSFPIGLYTLVLSYDGSLLSSTVFSVE